MPEVDMIKVELNWYKQIVSHIMKVNTNDNMTDEEKLNAITWLLKQLKKTDRDEDVEAVG
jgi:hypothetical protein